MFLLVNNCFQISFFSSQRLVRYRRYRHRSLQEYIFLARTCFPNFSYIFFHKRFSKMFSLVDTWFQFLYFSSQRNKMSNIFILVFKYFAFFLQNLMDDFPGLFFFQLCKVEPCNLDLEPLKPEPCKPCTFQTCKLEPCNLQPANLGFQPST